MLTYIVECVGVALYHFHHSNFTTFVLCKLLCCSYVVKCVKPFEYSLVFEGGGGRETPMPTPFPPDHRVIFLYSQNALHFSCH